MCSQKTQRPSDEQFSPLLGIKVAMIIVIINPLDAYNSDCSSKWPSDNYTQPFDQYASQSLETIFTTPFETTFLIQLMFRNPRWKSDFK